MSKFLREAGLAAILTGSAVVGWLGYNAYTKEGPLQYEKTEQKEQEHKTPEAYSAAVAIGALFVGTYLISTKVKKPFFWAKYFMKKPEDNPTQPK